jgi:SHS2 domain-containing protein
VAGAQGAGEAGPWRAAPGGGRYRTFETMADIGVEAEGLSIEAAEAAAVAGMYYIITPDARIKPKLKRLARGESKDPALAFARALQQLLVEFDHDGFVAARARVMHSQKGPPTCTIELEGDAFDPARDPPGVEIKAVTHHELVRDVAAKRVRVIFDV